MKGVVVSVVLCSLIAATVGLAGDEFFCYNNVKCNLGQKFEYEPNDCSAQWGGFGSPQNSEMAKEAKELISQQLQHSFEYLLIASHFKQWKENRPGFAKYFMKLSDDNWNEALALITHMVERGSKLDETFTVDMTGGANPSETSATESIADETELYPFQALTKALDKERRLATKTLHVSHLAIHGKGVAHDAAFGDFLAEKLQHNSVLRIKHLANYVRLLADIVKSADVDPSYALFKFDSEWLQ